jgi:hypothetical protein
MAGGPELTLSPSQVSMNSVAGLLQIVGSLRQADLLTHQLCLIHYLSFLYPDQGVFNDSYM